MSIASEITRINSNISSAYAGCRLKHAQMPQTQDSAHLRETIDSIKTGGSAVMMYDYDGTVLYAYEKNQILGMSELPAPPVHSGLTAIGWSWTIEDIKDSVQRGDTVDVGCLYSTSNGKTRLYISLTEDMVSEFSDSSGSFEGIEIAFGIVQSFARQVAVSWGDGSGIYTTDRVVNTLNNATNYLASHIYYTDENTVFPLNFIIELEAGTRYQFGQHNGSGIVCSGAVNIQKALCKIETAENCFLNGGAFSGLTALESCAVHRSFSDDGMYSNCKSLKCAITEHTFGRSNTGSSGTFENCFSLKAICADKSNSLISDSKSGFGSYTYSLKRVNNISTLQKVNYMCFYNSGIEAIDLSECTYIDSNSFSGCGSLGTVSGSQKCTYIGSNAFYGCGDLKIIDLSRAENISPLAFYNCAKLQNADLSSVVNIGESAFYGCNSIKSIVLSDNTQAVGANAFRNCREVRNITLKGSCTIGSQAFNTEYYQNAALEWVDLTAYLTPESIPTLSSTFTNTFVTSNRKGRKVLFYVANAAMKAAFSSATNWSSGAEHFIVGSPAQA